MGAWQEIVDYTVPSNTTSVVLDSFGTITKDDFVKVVTNFVGDQSGFIQLFYNTDTTNTNYNAQLLFGFNTSVTARRDLNSANFDYRFSGTTGTSIGYIKLSENDKANWFVNGLLRDASDLYVHMYAGTSISSFASGINKLTFTAEDPNGINTGSRIQIYKLAAEKVADITVGSNTTQVDISNLSIDKDSEYLLVSDVITATTGSSLFIFPNDLSTETQYYSQYIIADNTTTIVGRANQPFAWFNPASQRVLGYSHIKLSNIGAYTSQNYSIQSYGTTTPVLRSHFISSTYENLTSITKINLTLPTSIGTGSTFVLYKLY